MTVAELEEFLASIKTKSAQVEFMLNTNSDDLDAVLSGVNYSGTHLRIGLACLSLAINTDPITASIDLLLTPGEQP